MTEMSIALTGNDTSVSLLNRMSDKRHRSDAWNVFLDRYSRLIFSWCESWGVDPVTEEDVLQETMIRVLNAIDFFERRRTGSFRLWLRKLAHNSWVEINRERQRQLAMRRGSDRGRTLWDGPTSKAGFDHLADLCDVWATQEILEMAARRVRGRVSDDTWRTYSMLALDHRSIEQVTESTGISSEQAYNRFFRVRRLLKLEYDLLDAQQL